MIAQINEELIFEAEELEAVKRNYWFNKILNPAANISSLKSYLSKDLIAAFVVSLIALPLSMGIAIASGFPAVSGIYTALVGSFIITFISGTHVDIKGPASGLCVILLGAVHTFSVNGNLHTAYPFVLACMFVAGIVQIIFAFLRFGALGDSFPASAVLGMMASFGITIALKQIHLLVGVTPTGKNTIDLILEIPDSLQKMNLEVTLIGIICLIVMFGMSHVKYKWTHYIPAPLIVITIAIPLGLYAGLNQSADSAKQYLVALPENFLAGITFPDFSQLLSLTSLQYIIMIALAGSLESLLSSKAIEMADPEKRKSRLNKDLFAIGIGNAFLALIGGLPMISDAKRGLINVSYGAKTSWSNFFHGAFLLLIVVGGGSVIRLIPQTALAAIMIYLGYKLASPKQFSKTYTIGFEQLLVFLITMMVCLFSNLLWGILAGIVTEIVLHLYYGANIKSLFTTKAELEQKEANQYVLHLYDAAVFSNYTGVKKHLLKLPEYSNVTFDFSKTKIVDHTFLEHLYYHEENIQRKGGQINLSGLDYHQHLSEHPLASKRMLDAPAILKPRQEDLKKYAAKIGYDFDPRIITNIAKISPFLHSKNIQIRMQENVIKGTYKSFIIEIGDSIMHYENAGRTQERKMTNAFFYFDTFKLPDFYIEPDALDDHGHQSDYRDINFDKYDAFSYYYMLTGPDETAIRNFFEETVIRFFEKNKGFRIECINNHLFIYKKARRIKPEQMNILTDFTKHFIELLLSLTHRYTDKNKSIENITIQH